MLSYRLKCRENTKSISPLVSKTINGGNIILPKCVLCNSKKSRLIVKRSKRIIK